MRQMPLVVQNANEEGTINASPEYAKIWPSFQRWQLTAPARDDLE